MMDLKRKLYYSFSPRLRFLVRKIYYTPIDIYEKIFGLKDDLSPPKGMTFIGSGDFKKTGDHYLQMLITDCGLLPSHKILDIGCGIGRLAVPLTAYISKEGSYEGFDIVRQGIEWCKDKISKKFPNFNFTHIDLRNELYNLETDTTSAEFTFPYEDHSFDIVIATSLFTHMLPKDTERYVQEVSRLLKLNGKFLCTFFILNEVSKIAMKNNLHFNFQHIRGNYSLMDEKVKEANIAYEENYLNAMFSKNSLKIDKLTYGYWSGSNMIEKKEFQDTYVCSSVKTA